jgi:hypothetical protein
MSVWDLLHHMDFDAYRNILFLENKWPLLAVRG